MIYKTGEVCPVCGEEIQEQVIEFAGHKIGPHRVECTCMRKHREEQERLEKERERRERIGGIKAASGIPLRYQSVNFDTFIQNRDNVKSFSTVKKYVQDFEKHRKNGAGLLLSGPCGCGKTYLACAAANALAEQFYGNIFRKIGQIYDEAIQNYGVIPELYKNATLLIIDDFGAENATAAKQATLLKLIDARYDAMKPIIITSNLTFQEIDDKDKFDKRISDRIAEMCFNVPMVADSYRRRKGK